MNESLPPSQKDPASMWNVLCHASALLGLIFPLFFILGPFIVWLLKKEEFPSVNINGKEALNFQLSCLIYALISFVLVFVGIGILLLAAVGIFDLIFIIIASVQVSNGVAYRYPLTIRLIK
jgi:uncharacterized Tic20 family protein